MLLVSDSTERTPFFALAGYVNGSNDASSASPLGINSEQYSEEEMPEGGNEVSGRRNILKAIIIIQIWK